MDNLHRDASSTDASADDDSRQLMHVVGIGASAGGFEALEQFFSSMPPDSGMAFVVVQHLSPDHKSLMAELLSRHTRMHVLQVEHGVELKPDVVHLLPPKKLMTCSQGRLLLEDRVATPKPNFPIDLFLDSLARDQRERAIAIILSGTGSDGAHGVRTIKDEGGLVLVQDPDSAKFDGMPRSAMATGLPDYVLPPEQMPARLLAYVRHPSLRESGLIAREQRDEERLIRLFTMLREKTGVDFTYYKQSTVMRRIERRLSINQIGSLDDYLRYLLQNPEETHTLYNELLIGVTRFFRDPEAFDVLKEKVLPEIFRDNQGLIRSWVCGCSTGEEAYSLAMLFREYMEETGDEREIKIFATDIDKGALRFASNGLYPESVVADVSPARFNRFFIQKGDRCQVAKSVREMVIFAVHNFIKDPPFNKINLLSCRNLLIYLQPILQQRAFTFFNFAISESGFLFLGSSETVGAQSELFSVFHSKWRIYRCKGQHAPLPASGFFINPVRQNRLEARPEEKVRKPRVESRGQGGVGPVLERLMQEFLPPSCIINQRYEIVHVQGDLSPYVTIPPGRASLNISRIIRKDLAISVETAVNKALREDKQTSYRSIILEDRQRQGGRFVIDLLVRPFPPDSNGDKLVLVIFAETKPAPGEWNEAALALLDEHVQQRIKDLEHDLQFARESLQATLEEVETTNEELQATNEELLSANEELQSTNEELQSVNEELITVNAEYQSKIEELTELNNDMNNLLSATDIGVIFLDTQLCIRKFTPAIRDEVNLMDFDIGRPISHISLNISHPDLVQDAEEVLRTLEPIQREVGNSRGASLLMRVLPYVASDGTVKGVVVTFVDISGIKHATEQLRKLSAAVEASPAMIVITDAKGTIDYVNPRFTAVTGYELEEARGRNAGFHKSGRTGDREYRELWATITAGHTWSGMFHNLRKNGELFAERARIVPVRNEQGEIVSFLKLAEDVTGQLETREALRHEHEALIRVSETSPVAITMADCEGRLVFANRQAERLFQITREQIERREIQDPLWNILDIEGLPTPKEDLPFNRVQNSARPILDMRHSLELPDGRRVILSINAAPLFDANGGPCGMVSAITDIGGHVEREERLRFLASIVENTSDAVVGKTLEGVIVSWNRGAEALYGYAAEEIIGQSMTLLIPEGDEDECFRLLDRVRRGEHIADLHTRRKARDGSLLDISLTMSPILDETGDITGISTIARNLGGSCESKQTASPPPERP